MDMSKKRVSQKNTVVSSSHAASSAALPAGGVFMRKALAWGCGLLGLLITASFFTGTYDTAQVKDTLLFSGGTALIFLAVIR